MVLMTAERRGGERESKGLHVKFGETSPPSTFTMSTKKGRNTGFDKTFVTDKSEKKTLENSAIMRQTLQKSMR